MGAFNSIFTIHKYEIAFENFNEPIYLLPFGDVHRFADNCAEDRWLDYLDWCKRKQAETGRVYYLGMGDYDDFASTSERAGIRAAGLHDTTLRTIEDVARDRAIKMAGELSFMKDRIIGMIEGNHHFAFMSGVTSTQVMCEKLNTRYLGISSFIRLAFKHTRGNKNLALDIWAHHGRGGGKVGASVNKVQDMMNTAEADIYLMGDDHKKWAATVNRLSLNSTGNGLKLHNRKVLLARTGSFQLGYVPNRSNFVSSMGLHPTDLGVVKIELTPKRILFTTNEPRRTQRGNRQSETLEIDIHASI